MSKRDKGRISGQFVPLLHEMMDCPSYLAMSHGARCLYHARSSGVRLVPTIAPTCPTERRGES